MKEKVKMKNSKRYFLFVLSIYFPALLLIDGVVGKRLNIDFEYKSPEYLKRKKRCLNVLA
jgi:hypothetical protein